VNFKDILGQEPALNKLQKDIKEEKFPGAYLFAGPDGVGKKMAAICFAKALNCKKGKMGCSSCSSCIKMDKMVHPNLRIVAPQKSSIKIDQIRDLKKESSTKIYEGKKKVWIIDEAEKLTQEAANSLLKILEEPPPYLIIILVTSTPRLLPSTVLSRCRILQFLPLSRENIERILKDKKITEENLIPLISCLSQGSVSKALQISQREEILREREIILNLLKERKSLSAEIFKISERWSSQKNKTIDILLNMLLLFLRDIMMLKVGENENAIFNKDKKEEISKLKETYSILHLCRAIKEVEKSRILIQENISSQLVLEVMWIKILYPEYAI